MKYASIVKIFVPVALLGVFIVFAGNKKPVCEPVQPEEPVCSVPDDCEGLPHVECLGEWQCLNGLCMWNCDFEPPECVQSGCSGEVCAEQEVYTPCIWKPEFECLQYTKCGNFGENGECAFAKTDEYVKCMEQFEAECYSDADCKEGYYCQPLYKCGANEKCIGSPGICVPKEPETCFSDADCDPWEYCEIFYSGQACCPPNAFCIPEIPPCDAGQCVPKKGCFSDKDCPPGYICEGEIVCPPGAYCIIADQPGECVPDTGECFSDQDCKEGSFCQFEEECPPCVYTEPYCAMPCKITGKCVPYPDKCEFDTDCPDGYYCKLGPCPLCVNCPCYGVCEKKEFPQLCLNDYDCAEWQFCDMSVCLPPPGCDPNNPYVDCITLCYGECKDKEPLKCYGDYDCPKGQKCYYLEVCVCPACLPDSYCPPCECKPEPFGYCGPVEECFNEVCDGFDNDCDGYVDEDNVCGYGCTSNEDCPDGMACQIYEVCYDCAPDATDCIGGCFKKGDCVYPAPIPCFVSGCSGEVCASESIATPCWYLDWFKCLQFTKCGNFGPDGSCGWAQTDEFIKCLESLGNY